MKNNLKRLVSIILFASLLVTGFAVNTQAKSSNYVKSISVAQKATITIPANKNTVTKSYKVTVKVKNKASKAFTAKSDKTAVATVKVSKSSINVTAKKAGTANITVTTRAKGSTGKKLKKILRLTVKKVIPPAIDPEDDKAVGDLSRGGYELEQVVILSRHNIRSPLSTGDSLLSKVTPYSWFNWSSNPSELSLRGGVLETEMGQFFRKWMEAEKLIPENYHPDEKAVRIYANSKQRTIATAQYFASGLLPTAKAQIETHMEYDTMDPVFTPKLTFVSPEYNADAEKQVWESYKNTVDDLADNYELLSNVIDFKDSRACQDGSMSEFRTDDTELVFEMDKEPAMKGTLKNACSISDALVLQYYEEQDAKKAAFGKNLSNDQWKQISEIKDTYGDVLFTTPLVSANVAHPLLDEINKELKTDNRKFTFLCGHDSNIGSVLAALGAESYDLPGAVETRTPIGCKLVFCRWKNPNGEKYCTVDMAYQTTSQLRNAPLLDLDNHPAIVPMKFSAIKPNNDGLYAEKDFMNLLQQSIDEYNTIVTKYSAD